MTNTKAIFVGGVHGVGKSTAARSMSDVLDAETVTASELIREAREGQKTWDAQKRVHAINENQDLLVRAWCGRTWKKNIVILDGHFTLRGSDGNIQPIPVDVYRSLNLSLLIVLTADSEDIASRLYARDGTEHSKAVVEEMQQSEIEHARLVSEEIGVRLVLSRAEEIEALAIQLKGLALLG